MKVDDRKSNVFWDLERRLKLSIIATMALLIALYAGSLFPLNQEDSQRVAQEAKELIGQDISAIRIFTNNIAITLLMLLPIAGALIGVYIAFSTGLAFSALSMEAGLSPILAITMTLVLVFGLVEFLAYGLASSESIILAHAIVRKRLGSEIRKIIPILILIIVGLLGAAFLEFAIVDLII